MDCFPTPSTDKFTRKRKADPENWKRNLAKKQRYVPKGLPQRLLCNHKKTFKCLSITMADIKHFFDGFYSEPDKIKQDAFILKHCISKKVKRHRPTKSKYSEQSFQTTFYIYSLSEKKMFQVCQNFFLGVLQIKKYRVQTVMKTYFHSGKLLTETRGGDRISVKYTAKREAIKSFINKIPCKEPHYCRGSTKRYYLSSELSINKLAKMYNQEAPDDVKVKPSFFRKVFNTNYNLSFGTPRTDVCCTCLKFDQDMKRETDLRKRTDLMTLQRVHKLKANVFFKKAKEEQHGLKTFSFDCEKNLNLLKVPDQISYYLRNIYMYNFTIVEGCSKSELNPGNVFAYCWTENEFPKAANEIASAVFHRLNNSDLSNIHTIRLISDGCAGQNKNTTMISMLCKWLTQAPNHIKKIEMIFPVVGHSFIPPDRVFAHIEKEVRKREVIDRPDIYLDIISQFSTVYRMGPDCEVFDWKSACHSIFKPVGSWNLQFKQCKRFELKRSKRIGNVLINDHIFYQNDNSDGFKNLCKKGKTVSMIDPVKIDAGNNISDLKKKDILKLLKSRYGDDWRQNMDLSFFGTVLSVTEEDVTEENDECDEFCEQQHDVLYHV